MKFSVTFNKYSNNVNLIKDLKVTEIKVGKLYVTGMQAFVCKSLTEKLSHNEPVTFGKSHYHEGCNVTISKCFARQ